MKSVFWSSLNEHLCIHTGPIDVLGPKNMETKNEFTALRKLTAQGGQTAGSQDEEFLTQTGEDSQRKLPGGGCT